MGMGYGWFLRFPESELWECGKRRAVAPQKTVLIVLGSPYLIQNYPNVENYIYTYSLVFTAVISAVKSLFGEILPVTLPGIAERGSSKPWPKQRRD
jgi:hypothetical protein